LDPPTGTKGDLLYRFATPTGIKGVFLIFLLIFFCCLTFGTCSLHQPVPKDFFIFLLIFLLLFLLHYIYNIFARIFNGLLLLCTAVLNITSQGWRGGTLRPWEETGGEKTVGGKGRKEKGGRKRTGGKGQEEKGGRKRAGKRLNWN
jgi:hypothetical protein